MKENPEFKSSMNIKYSKKIIVLCKNLGLKISFYDRRMEPPEIKEKEGLTTIWGTKEAIKKAGGVPDVIYHEGDYGKEPMVIILGKKLFN
jgi:hydroxymethylpyrimidine/phosphomethylpyrimidine kinase